LSTPVTASPHSWPPHFSSACTIPAARHALITRLGSQFCVCARILTVNSSSRSRSIGKFDVLV
jgi:hypothetical protein